MRIDAVTSIDEIRKILPIEEDIESKDKSMWASSMEDRVDFYSFLVGKKEVTGYSEHKFLMAYNEEGEIVGYMAVSLILGTLKFVNRVHIHRAWYDKKYPEAYTEALQQVVDWGKLYGASFVSADVYNNPRLVEMMEVHGGFKPYQVHMRKEV